MEVLAFRTKICGQTHKQMTEGCLEAEYTGRTRHSRNISLFTLIMLIYICETLRQIFKVFTKKNTI